MLPDWMPTYISSPTKEMCKNISEEFEKKPIFRIALVQLMGNIRIINPLGSMYFNYRSYSSVLSMAVADANYSFNYVYIGSYGKECDSSIFKRSSLWTSIINNELELQLKNTLAE